MTTCLGKSCSFGQLCVNFVCILLSLLVLRMECGILLYKFLIIAFLFTFPVRVLVQDVEFDCIDSSPSLSHLLCVA